MTIMDKLYISFVKTTPSAMMIGMWLLVAILILVIFVLLQKVKKRTFMKWLKGLLVIYVCIYVGLLCVHVIWPPYQQMTEMRWEKVDG